MLNFDEVYITDIPHALQFSTMVYKIHRTTHLSPIDLVFIIYPTVLCVSSYMKSTIFDLGARSYITNSYFILYICNTIII